MGKIEPWASFSLALCVLSPLAWWVCVWNSSDCVISVLSGVYSVWLHTQGHTVTQDKHRLTDGEWQALSNRCITGLRLSLTLSLSFFISLFLSLERDTVMMTLSFLSVVDYSFFHSVSYLLISRSIVLSVSHPLSPPLLFVITPKVPLFLPVLPVCSSQIDSVVLLMFSVDLVLQSHIKL